jgi:hypothetical protein
MARRQKSLTTIGQRKGPAFVGEIRMYDINNPVLHRYVSVVDLVERSVGGLGKPLLPSLIEPKIVTLGNDALVLTGFERIARSDGRQVDYAQSWWVQLRS